jgi:pimeloyl-ACP methyl ester carboxylesterase
MSSAPTPEGPGSVWGAPHPPEGFTDTFTSRYVDNGELRLHAVTGGDGPPLLLVHGWPQTWYQWRLVMPTLARDFQVVAVDQRGIGLSDKPEGGYDTATLARDLVALMDALGHRRFAVVGFDTGMLISYALAADHPDRVERLVVGEAPLPGISPPTPLILPPRPWTGVVGLVYVAAFAPDEGERLGEVEANSKDSILNTALVQRQYPTGQDSQTAVEFAINPALFREAFAADLPTEQTAVMAATQRPVAASAFTDTSGPPAWKTLPSWAVVATRGQGRRQRRRPFHGPAGRRRHRGS